MTRVAAGVALALAVAAGFGASQLRRGDGGAAASELRAAKVSLQRFDPPAVGTTSVPALRVPHKAKAKSRPSAPAATKPTSTPNATTPVATPRTVTPPRTTNPPAQTSKPKPGGGPVDTIGRTKGGEG